RGTGVTAIITTAAGAAVLRWVFSAARWQAQQSPRRPIRTTIPITTRIMRLPRTPIIRQRRTTATDRRYRVRKELGPPLRGPFLACPPLARKRHQPSAGTLLRRLADRGARYTIKSEPFF